MTHKELELDKYKKDGGFEDENGCFYDDAESFLQASVLKFCGCGRPGENLEYILGALELINESRPEDQAEQINWWKDKQARAMVHFGCENAAYFFYYWADKEDFTEHGGSVPGWLTEKGDRLLTMLREYKELKHDD